MHHHKPHGPDACTVATMQRQHDCAGAQYRGQLAPAGRLVLKPCVDSLQVVLVKSN